MRHQGNFPGNLVGESQLTDTMVSNVMPLKYVVLEYQKEW